MQIGTNTFRNTLTIAVFILAISAIQISAATFTVTNINDSSAGSLRQAILDANAAAGADTIVFSSLFNSPQTITLALTLVIDSADNTALTITGPGANLLTVSGNNTVRVLDVRDSETITISGMTMTQGNSLNGTSPGLGGAIYIGNATATLNGVVVSGNSATSGGGGIYLNSNNSITITNSTITNNTTNNVGGGIRATAPNSAPVGLTITNTTVSNNTVVGGGNSFGGGIHNDAKPMNMDNCLVTGNTVAFEGGGIYISTSQTQTITNSVISNNSTTGVNASGNGSGGGIYRQNTNAPMTITNTLITGNRATHHGGGIFDSEGTGLNIIGSTISNNTANTDGGTSNFNGGHGGGIFLRRESTGSVATITNSTISGNNVLGLGECCAGSGGGIYTSNPINITNSTVSGNTATGSGGGIAFNTLTNINRVHNITNSTIANNTVTTGGSGGGLHRLDNGTFTTVNLQNSIFANNTGSFAPDINGIYNSNGFNLIETLTGATIGGTTTGNITGQDPNLAPLSFNGGATRTHALLVGSPAIDTGDTTTFPATDQRGITRPQDGDGAGGARSDIGSYERRISDILANNRFDFDGDGKTDLAIFRPAPGEWWYSKSSNGGNFAAQFGASTDKIVPGDYTGDGKSDFAFYRPSTGQWFILRSEDFSFFAFPFGISTDVPVPADYDGDGKTDAAVYRPSTNTWFISKSTGGTDIIGFGISGDVPTVGDYDGDGRSDIAIYRPSLGQWWIRRSSNLTVYALTFGNSTDKPVQGDYTGDGKTDNAIFRPSTGSWFILRSEDFSFYAFPFGISTDVLAPGDYDGDGKTDAAVFRPSNSTWFVQRSTAGTLIQGFGIAGDLPVPNAFVP